MQSIHWKGVGYKFFTNALILDSILFFLKFYELVLIYQIILYH
jgi:hypothetical protein